MVKFCCLVRRSRQWNSAVQFLFILPSGFGRLGQTHLKSRLVRILNSSTEVGLHMVQIWNGIWNLLGSCTPVLFTPSKVVYLCFFITKPPAKTDAQIQICVMDRYRRTEMKGWIRCTFCLSGAKWLKVCVSIFHTRADASFPLLPPFFFNHR